MGAIVFGSPEAQAQRDIDRQIEALPPCRCGAPPILGTSHEPGDAAIWHVIECSNRHCRQKFSLTLPNRTVADALDEWITTHKAVQP